MRWKNTELRYGTLSIGLHWLMLLLIAGVYTAIQLKGVFPKGSDMRGLVMQWHFMLGLSVFSLVWLRILFIATGAKPKIQPPSPALQEKLARLVHFALYALMIGAPLAGWLTLSAAGKPVPFFGFELPPLIGKNPDLAKQIKDVHEFVGTAGYWLIGLHAAAALFHHHFMRDNTLRMMLPERK